MASSNGPEKRGWPACGPSLRRCPHRPRWTPRGCGSNESRWGSDDLVLIGDPEIPLQFEVLPLGVAHDPFPVAPELRIMGRQQGQPGDGAIAKRVDDLSITIIGLHLPMRSH